MLAYLAERARERGCEGLEIPYCATAKNQPIWNFLLAIGQPEQKSDREWLFRFSVEELIGLSFSPVSVVFDVSADEAIPAVTVPALPYERIANKLQSWERVQEAIDLHNRTETVASAREYVEPRDVVEQELARHWCKLLGLSSASVYDRFFEFGGNSLLATRLVSAIRTTFAVDLSLSQVFDQPTIAGLATTIKTLQVLQSVSSSEGEREEIEL
jgi:acyl carrier protein